MSTQKNLITLCFATVFTLGLAACGGGGGGDAPVTSMLNGNGAPPEGPPEPGTACTASATSQDCVDDKKMALDEAMKALVAAKADGSSTLDQIKDAEMAVYDAQMAYDDAMEARNTYLAMQPSTYDHTAVAKAISLGEDDVSQVTQGLLEGVDVVAGKVTVGNGDTKFAASTSEIADLGRSWMGAVYTRMTMDVPQTQKNEYMAETVVIYTDDEGPDSAMFSEHYRVGSAGEETGEGAPDDHSDWVGVVTSVATSDPDDVDDVDTRVLTLGGAVDDDSRAQIVGLSKTLDPEETDHTIKGMFHGVSGTYGCSDMDCELLFNDAGELTKLGGTWTFTPGKPATYVIGVIPDAAYLDFGYWVIETPGNDGPVYEVGTFAMGKGGVAVNPGTMAGKATYTGPATGLYVRKSIDSDTLEGTPVASGQFTADAKLTAYLGTMPSYAAVLEDKISGTVSKFLDMDGNMIASGWAVELMETDIIEDDAAGRWFTGDTTGDGNWEGNFYEARDVDEAPGSVAGTFDAHFVNGHVAGAFGANADE